MVHWVQPSTTVNRAVMTPILGIGQLLTITRLVVRYRSKRMWLDDAWAALALVCSFMLLTAMWIRTDMPGVGPLNQPREVRIVAYWMGALSFTNTLWASRMSIIFSVIRLIPPMMRLRRISNISAVLFILMWIGLLIQKTYICASNKYWYQRADPMCRLGHGVATNEIITDSISDILLAVIPIRLLHGVSLQSDQRKMLYIIFGSSLLITLVSAVHAIFVFGPSGRLEAITAQAQAATAIIVADVGVLGSLAYRRIRKGLRDFDSKPYSYEFSLHTNTSIHMHRVLQGTARSTQPQFARDPELYSCINEGDRGDCNSSAERTRFPSTQVKTLDLKEISSTPDLDDIAMAKQLTTNQTSGTI
ncbi:hypothetical protein E1B28_010482 [Marasmius oreades]|uniref:Rhodopsin domain-containing protein n=1 Tax=Marasmius oreades TaxID=181124 RepID=A0A9P7RXV0_9AGAR|nr:uncharacterized protein E1B28_010482 [Marasmius oreades]KAG7091448.1 hypothetical protein E1B28_010482 [Marasmius oreades]